MKNKFKEIYKPFDLNHHKFKTIYNYLNWLFKDFNFVGKKVLDVGGGKGLCSYYSMYKGAKSCPNLEPFLAGSSGAFIDNTINDLKVSYINKTFQDFEAESKFDIITMHDTINHLDEDVYIKLDKDHNSKIIYNKLVHKMNILLNKNGLILVSDCAKSNFFGDLGLKSPFAPSIEWHLHQNPNILVEIFKSNGFELISKRWSPFKRFGIFGFLISKFGFLPSYFMQSHFNLVFRKK